MNVIASTAAYERWLRKLFAPIEVDLARKVERFMKPPQFGQADGLRYRIKL